MTIRYCVMQLVGPDLGKLRRSLIDKSDVKAPNFATGLGTESGVIYMLDFGFARKYKEANGEIIPPRSAAALLGTFQENIRFLGPLPWCKIDGHKEHQTIAAQKKLIRRERRADFMEGMPSEFDRILTMIDNMGFYDQPPYTLFQSLIEQAAKKLRITLHEPFDWQVNARVLKKGEFVGELGESNLASMKMGEEEEETDTSVDTMPIDIET
ncbi:hypothetical protein ANCCEY_04694 [Ancylostoma ceylanicum]|uniref:Protein kinase domain-containing protein n=1 Tax=Ancylostoma ceylanicum TaxID=53326 RepID=A0A0D6M1I2_9BILA|nr:hypothetical protein ANCCEY_04694 [Ancylostoma ceylanicum]